MAQGERAAARDERAQRILDAAVELLLRWGYDKTTVDDVAREASVAKGTIYLHWRNRDELFLAVLRRERVRLLTEVREQVAADPSAATLRVLISSLSSAYLRRGLLKALLAQDTSVLGKLGRQERAKPARAVFRDEFVHYLDLLREQGLIRTDLRTAELVNLTSAVFFGFFTVPGMVPSEYAISEDEAAGLLTETLCAALERGTQPGPDHHQRMAEATMRYLDDAVADAEAKYRLVAGPAESPEQESAR